MNVTSLILVSSSETSDFMWTGSKVLTGTHRHFFGEAVVLPPLLSFVDLGSAIVFSRTRIDKVEK